VCQWRRKLNIGWSAFLTYEIHVTESYNTNGINLCGYTINICYAVPRDCWENKLVLIITTFPTLMYAEMTYLALAWGYNTETFSFEIFSDLLITLFLWTDILFFSSDDIAHSFNRFWTDSSIIVTYFPPCDITWQALQHFAQRLCLFW
jgi:hypothetical protein